MTRHQIQFTVPGLIALPPIKPQRLRQSDKHSVALKGQGRASPWSTLSKS